MRKLSHYQRQPTGSFAVVVAVAGTAVLALALAVALL
jgi:hypothetical protein